MVDTSLFSIGVSESNGNSLITCTFVAVVRVIENFLMAWYVEADQIKQADIQNKLIKVNKSEIMYLL
jgi:ABC-type sulfate transport system permease component